MPELPELTVYVEALERRLVGQQLRRIAIRTPFLLRTVVPSVDSVRGRQVIAVRRIGKRIAIGLQGEFWLVVHLMSVGRLHWIMSERRPAMRAPLALLEFDNGTISITEGGTKRRASLHLVMGEKELQRLNPGGLEIFEASFAQFVERLRSENHTLKRALTDPRLIAGIGNAYADEILHAARLSPVLLTKRIDDAALERLFRATQQQMHFWISRLRDLTGGQFPERLPASHRGMAVHGRFQLPCPVCGTLIQRIRYAGRETNYCARCQNDGRLLADRALSRLLKKDWPRTVDELEPEGMK